MTEWTFIQARESGCYDKVAALTGRVIKGASAVLVHHCQNVNSTKWSRQGTMYSKNPHVRTYKLYRMVYEPAGKNLPF